MPCTGCEAIGADVRPNWRAPPRLTCRGGLCGREDKDDRVAPLISWSVDFGMVLGMSFGAVAAGPDAPAPDRELVLGLRVAPPFAMKAPDGIWTGITVELWRHLAEQLGLRFRFEETTAGGASQGAGRWQAGCLGRGADGYGRAPARSGFLSALFGDGSRRGGPAAVRR